MTEWAPSGVQTPDSDAGHRLVTAAAWDAIQRTIAELQVERDEATQTIGWLRGEVGRLTAEVDRRSALAADAYKDGYTAGRRWGQRDGYQLGRYDEAAGLTMRYEKPGGSE